LMSLLKILLSLNDASSLEEVEKHKLEHKHKHKLV
jgi:hypothetical protein